MNFGDVEGLHFDGLSNEEKEEYSDPDYEAPNGESWKIVTERTHDYFKTLSSGNHLIFMHGGPLACIL